MDTLTHFVNGAGELFEGFLKQAHLVSIFLGLVLSFGVTQWVKSAIRLRYHKRAADPQDRMTEEESIARHRLVVRTVACLTGLIATFLTWPDGSVQYRIVWALTVGFASPTIYWIVLRIAARRWPDLAAAVSSDSKLPEDEK